MRERENEEEKNKTNEIWKEDTISLPIRMDCIENLGISAFNGKITLQFQITNKKESRIEILCKKNEIRKHENYVIFFHFMVIYSNNVFS